MRAVGSGTVTFAGYIAGKPVISIELANSVTTLGSRVRSTYEPVNSMISAGSYISTGEVIATSIFPAAQLAIAEIPVSTLGSKWLAKPPQGISARGSFGVRLRFFIPVRS